MSSKSSTFLLVFVYKPHAAMSSGVKPSALYSASAVGPQVPTEKCSSFFRLSTPHNIAAPSSYADRRNYKGVLSPGQQRARCVRSNNVPRKKLPASRQSCLLGYISQNLGL
ncbi:hypothetical protein LSAT2_009834 [Lamellibrachia satsuma]|nr:hypothetical protein LSAT2_009834 [Lamellibrachia satsuma]